MAKDCNKDCPSETDNLVFDQLPVHKLLFQMCSLHFKKWINLIHKKKKGYNKERILQQGRQTIILKNQEGEKGNRIQWDPKAS